MNANGRLNCAYHVRPLNICKCTHICLGVLWVGSNDSSDQGFFFRVDDLIIVFYHLENSVIYVFL